LKNHKSRFKNITEFLTEQKKRNIICEEFNAGLAKQFSLWLKVNKKASQNHVVKNISFIKQTIKHAMQGEHLNYDPLAALVVKRDKPKPVVYLSTADLALLETFAFAQDRLGKIRDVFVFCCHTGLSYVDVSRMDASVDVKDGWIKMKRAKTHHPFLVPLSEKAKGLLTKYAGRLPVASNVKMNAYLKEVAEVVGLPQYLTMHVSRKTFGMLMLNKGVPLETVSRMLGHSNTRVTQSSYAQVNEDRIREDMKGMY